MTLEMYEVTDSNVTGFKVLKGDKLVGTIEQRSGSWIGAYFDKKIVQMKSERFENVMNWIYNAI